MIQVIPFARALTNTREDAITAVSLRNIVDQFLNNNRFTNTSTTEGSDLTTEHERGDQIDNFDARFKDLYFGGLLFQGRCVAMNWIAWSILNVWLVVYCATQDVKDTSQCLGANRDAD